MPLNPNRQRIIIATSDTPGNVPAGLEVGELGIDIANPPRMWIGCNTAVDASGQLRFPLGIDSVMIGITAAATPPVLTAQFNVVSMVDSGAGVRLPIARAGEHCLVRNSGASILRVYPPIGGRINSIAVDAFIQVGTDLTGYFEAASAMQWYSVP